MAQVRTHASADTEQFKEQMTRNQERFRELGIDGVEVFYKTHTRDQTELLAKHCEELGILRTGSADFHGPDHKAFAKFLDFQTYGHEPNLGPIAR